MRSISKFRDRLLQAARKQLTGVLTVATSEEKQWRIYLYQGTLLWAEGGSHAYRFWQRNLNLFCSHVDIRVFEREKILSNSSSDYYFITTLLDQKLASREQVKSLAKKRVLTVLFDILQAENNWKLEYKMDVTSARAILKHNFNLTICHFPIPETIASAQKSWFTWASKGLSSCSPNLAPILKKNTQLSQQVSPMIFKNMKRMLDGKSTLRDLSAKMDKDVFEVTCGLVPYFFKGYIRLIEIPDLTGVKLPTYL